VRSTELLARAWAEHAATRAGWNTKSDETEASLAR
jgi:hypothetical protein